MLLMAMGIFPLLYRSKIGWYNSTWSHTTSASIRLILSRTARHKASPVAATVAMDEAASQKIAQSMLCPLLAKEGVNSTFRHGSDHRSGYVLNHIKNHGQSLSGDDFFCPVPDGILPDFVEKVVAFPSQITHRKCQNRNVIRTKCIIFVD